VWVDVGKGLIHGQNGLFVQMGHLHCGFFPVWQAGAWIGEPCLQWHVNKKHGTHTLYTRANFSFLPQGIKHSTDVVSNKHRDRSE